jgi:hypothetical protein
MEMSFGKLWHYGEEYATPVAEQACPPDSAPATTLGQSRGALAGAMSRSEAPSIASGLLYGRSWLGTR